MTSEYATEFGILFRWSHFIEIKRLLSIIYRLMLVFLPVFPSNDIVYFPSRSCLGTMILIMLTLRVRQMADGSHHGWIGFSFDSHVVFFFSFGLCNHGQSFASLFRDYSGFYSTLYIELKSLFLTSLISSFYNYFLFYCR